MTQINWQLNSRIVDDDFEKMQIEGDELPELPPVIESTEAEDGDFQIYGELIQVIEKQ